MNNLSHSGKPVATKSKRPRLASINGNVPLQPNDPRTLPAVINLSERRTLAVKLYKDNQSIAQTAAAMIDKYPNYDRSSCYKDICAALYDLAIARNEITKHLVIAEVEKLASIESETWKLLNNADTESTKIGCLNVLINLSNHRRKLLGLDVVKESRSTVTVEHSIADKVIKAQKTIDAEFSEEQ